MGGSPRPPTPCPAPTSKAPTLLEVFQVAELHQAVPIVVVGDVDPVILRGRVLHPGSLMAPIAVVPHRGVHGPEGALTAGLPACGERGEQHLVLRPTGPESKQQSWNTIRSNLNPS